MRRDQVCPSSNKLRLLKFRVLDYRIPKLLVAWGHVKVLIFGKVVINIL